MLTQPPTSIHPSPGANGCKWLIPLNISEYNCYMSGKSSTDLIWWSGNVAMLTESGFKRPDFWTSWLSNLAKASKLQSRFCHTEIGKKRWKPCRVTCALVLQHRRRWGQELWSLSVDSARCLARLHRSDLFWIMRRKARNTQEKALWNWEKKNFTIFAILRFQHFKQFFTIKNKNVWFKKWRQIKRSKQFGT